MCTPGFQHLFPLGIKLRMYFSASCRANQKICLMLPVTTRVSHFLEKMTGITFCTLEQSLGEIFQRALQAMMKNHILF